jgi:hypothetical protein
MIEQDVRYGRARQIDPEGRIGEIQIRPYPAVGRWHSLQLAREPETRQAAG